MLISTGFFFYVSKCIYFGFSDIIQPKDASSLPHWSASITHRYLKKAVGEGGVGNAQLKVEGWKMMEIQGMLISIMYC